MMEYAKSRWIVLDSLRGLRVSEKLAAGSIRDEINGPLYAP
jgi:hypothetical protein